MARVWNGDGDASGSADGLQSTDDFGLVGAVACLLYARRDGRCQDIGLAASALEIGDFAASLRYAGEEAGQ